MCIVKINNGTFLIFDETRGVVKTVTKAANIPDLRSVYLKNNC